MAISAVNEDLFGAPGVSDPYAFEPGLVGIMRRINFNVANAEASTAYAFIPVPKGMVITGVRFTEAAKCGAGNVSLKICDGTSDDKAVGTSFTVGGDTLATSVQNLATPIVVDKNSMVCLVPSAKQTAGGVIATVLGYLADGESIEAIDLDSVKGKWRVGQTEEQFKANVSGGDAYNANRIGVPIYPVANDQ